MQEIYNWIDLVKMCTEPQHFIDMSELLKEQVTQLLEALKVVIQLHGVVHT